MGRSVRYFNFAFDQPMKFRAGIINGVNGTDEVNVVVFGDAIHDVLNRSMPPVMAKNGVPLVDADPTTPHLSGHVCVLVDDYKRVALVNPATNEVEKVIEVPRSVR